MGNPTSEAFRKKKILKRKNRPNLLSYSLTLNHLHPPPPFLPPSSAPVLRVGGSYCFYYKSFQIPWIHPDLTP